MRHCEMAKRFSKTQLSKLKFSGKIHVDDFERKVMPAFASVLKEVLYFICSIFMQDWFCNILAVEHFHK